MRRTHWLLLLPFLLSIAYLVLGEKPWNGALESISRDLAAGERPDWRDDTILGLYGAAALNALLCVFLAATAGFWTRTVSLRPAPAAPGISAGAPPNPETALPRHPAWRVNSDFQGGATLGCGVRIDGRFGAAVCRLRLK